MAAFHVLVVEDELIQRLAIIDILQLHEYTCDQAENG